MPEPENSTQTTTLLTAARPRSAFPETSWTLVLSAGDTQASHGAEALTTLCRTYWYPVYAFIRRKGHDADRAQDLTQEFFLQILARKFFSRADRQHGRFRSFLMASVQFFLADQSDIARAVKRGGGVQPLPFEVSDGESWYLREPAHSETPERIFERRWARAVLDRVIDRLRDDFARHGRLDQFLTLRSYILGNGDVPYADLARRLDITEVALRTTVSRFRKRFRDLLRAEVAATVAVPGEVDGELRFLIAALSSGEGE